MRIFLRILPVLVAVLMGWDLQGQRTGTATTGTTTPTTTTGTTTTPAPTITVPTPAPATPAPRIPSPIFLSGSVVTDDGSEIPHNASVQSRCGMEDHTVTYVRSNGDFSFRWGETGSTFADASESRNAAFTAGGTSSDAVFGSSSSNSTSGPFGQRIGSCELLVRSPGYTSSSLNIFNHSSSDTPEVGTIVIHRIGADEGRTVSLNSLKAPGNAKKAYQAGMKSLDKARYPEALKSFEAAVAAYPEYADAWLRMGLAQNRLQNYTEAKAAFLEALRADAKLVGPSMQLGLLAAREANWMDAAKYLDDATKLDPLSPAQAWYIDAVANYNLKRTARAELAVRAAIKMDVKKENPRAEYLLGMTLGMKRDYRGATEHLTAYLKSAPGAQDTEHVRQELLRIEKISQVVTE